METVHEPYFSRLILRKASYNIALVACLILVFFDPSLLPAQTLKKVPLPFSPIGINCLPWFVAKEARIYEKHGIDVDPVFIGASSVLIQSMLSGAADMAGSGGPSIISNVLQGGNIIRNSHGSTIHSVNHGEAGDQTARRYDRQKDRSKPAWHSHTFRPANRIRRLRSQGRDHPANGRTTRGGSGVGPGLCRWRRVLPSL